MEENEDFLRELRSTFLEELADILDNIEVAFLKFEKAPQDAQILQEIFRYFHNIKGSSKTVGLGQLSEFAHKAENLLDGLRQNQLAVTDDMVDQLLLCTDLMRDFAAGLGTGDADGAPLLAHAEILHAFCQSQDGVETSIIQQSEDESESEGNASEASEDSASGFGFFDEAEPTLPVSSGNEALPEATHADRKLATSPAQAVKKKADEFIKVPIDRINQILDLFGEQVIIQSTLDHTLDSGSADIEQIQKTISQMKKITQDLQYIMVTLRMVSMESLFNRMERAVRDVGRMTAKKIEFRKDGQGMELDKSIVDALIDPLTHMVRNAADHGIEAEDVREAAGKPRQGQVTLSARRFGGAMEIAVADDGKGLDPAYIMKKAVEKGLIKAGTQLAEPQIFALIFRSGFSTLEQATEISGRGVGMDVVHRQIEHLKGKVNIQSQVGKGTKFCIRIPLSLAMFNGTVVDVRGMRYVIPNSDFSEALTLKEAQVDANGGNNGIARLGDRVMRIIDLRRSLNHKGHSSKKQGEGINLAVVVPNDGQLYALLVSDILSQEQIVLKELGPEGKQIRGVSGCTILGDGRVALVLDLPAIIKRDRIVESRARAA